MPLKLKRKRNPYLLRIRPYYQQMVGELDITKFDAMLNESPVSPTTKAITQNLSHGGVRVSLILPFGKDKKQPKQETTGLPATPRR